MRHIIRRPSGRYTIVTTDETANQTRVPLNTQHAPAHYAVMRGTSDAAIAEMSRHPGAVAVRTIAALADHFDDCTPTESQAARTAGRPYDAR